MAKEKFHVERTDRGFWAYQQRSAGLPDRDPLHGTLLWILQQLNLKYCQPEVDDRGDVVTLTLGRKAVCELDSDESEVVRRAKDRLLTVYVAGALAGEREAGTKPEFEGLHRNLRDRATDGGYFNTELHYAFEMVELLRDIRQRALLLDPPPVRGLAPELAVWYLREATRCYLYGLHGASVALCRACLEASLDDCVSARQIENERKSPDRPCRTDRDPTKKRGKLELSIDAATRRGFLNHAGCEQAHEIRVRGNEVMHADISSPWPNHVVSGEQSQTILDHTREVVKQVFSSSGGTPGATTD